jgi:predicted RNA-binding protein with PUA-like domain
MNVFRQIALLCLLTLLTGCASRSTQAIAKLDDKSSDFSTGACQNARQNAWVHDELKTHKLWASMPLLQKGSRLSVQPVTEKEFQYIIKLSS